MKILDFSQQDRFVEQEDRANIASAPLTTDLSKVEFVEAGQSFFSTVDKMLFKSPVEIVATVLKSQGYLINLENLLSSLEQWRFIPRVRFTGKEQNVPKSWLPAITFKLPSKSQVGDLLSHFYREIETYEVRLAEFEGKSKTKDGAETPEEMRKEIKKLHDENESLKASLTEMSNKLSLAHRSHADVERALVSQNILPESVRFAKVRDIHLQDRHITLKSGRKTVSLPMAFLKALPEIGDACLVSLDDGNVKGAFFFDSEGKPFDVKIANVLYVKNDLAKVRDSDRRVWFLDGLNDAERAIIREIRRGQKVLLHLIDDQMIRFEECKKSDTTVFGERVQEAITLQQLRTQQMERKGDKEVVS